MSAQLNFQLDELGGRPVLATRGELDARSAPPLREALAELMFDPVRVFVDVSELRVHWAPAAAVFAAVLAEGGGWPRAGLVLVGPDRALARALRA